MRSFLFLQTHLTNINCLQTFIEQSKQCVGFSVLFCFHAYLVSLCLGTYFTVCICSLYMHFTTTYHLSAGVYRTKCTLRGLFMFCLHSFVCTPASLYVLLVWFVCTSVFQKVLFVYRTRCTLVGFFLFYLTEWVVFFWLQACLATTYRYHKLSWHFEVVSHVNMCQDATTQWHFHPPLFFHEIWPLTIRLVIVLKLPVGCVNISHRAVRERNLCTCRVLLLQVHITKIYSLLLLYISEPSINLCLLNVNSWPLHSILKQVERLLTLHQFVSQHPW